jgi:hypothetical protein
MEIAELCRRHAAAHLCHDWNARRDQLLLIAVEWDISRDRLDLQSDECLQAIAEFLCATIWGEPPKVERLSTDARAMA